MSHTYKLIYFNGQGRGEVARLLFAAAGQAFKDERVNYDAWPALKPQMPYGQLPVLEVDGKLFCQSEGIFRFLARQFGLYGKDNLEGFEIDQILGVTNDVFADYVKVNYYLKGDEQAQAKEKLQSETLPKYISFLEKLLGSNEYFVGNKLSLADVMVYDFIGFKIPALCSGWKSGSKAVDDLLQRVGDTPNIKSYVAARPN